MAVYLPPRRLAWLLLKETNGFAPEENQHLSVLRTDPEVETIYHLACSYVSMIREQKEEPPPLHSWVSWITGPTGSVERTMHSSNRNRHYLLIRCRRSLTLKRADEHLAREFVEAGGD